MLSIRRDKYLLDCYSDISEMYNDLKDKPRRPNAKDGSDDRDNSRWYGSNSLDDAYDLMIKGDSELYKKIKDTLKKLDVEKIIGNVIKKNTTYNSVVGFQPNVPNYLKGIPIDMIAEKPTRKSQKILNIVINVTVSCGISAESYQKAGAYYYAIIDLLEKSGYRCNVYVMIAEDDDRDNIYLMLRAKTDREPFNKEKIAFLLAHPSFFRRVGFKWIESCNCKSEPTRYGYGTPITNNKKIKDIVDKELKADFMIWSIQDDYKVEIETIIKKLKDKGIKIGED